MSTYKAVIFDLWGTLVDDVVYPEANRLAYQQMTDKLADWLGVDRGEFSKAWDASGAERHGRPLHRQPRPRSIAYLQRGLELDPGRRVHPWR